jgi:hypothetical protein
MSSSQPGLFGIDSTTVGSWFGIRFAHTPATNDSSRLEYCLIEHCKAAGDSSRGAAFSLTDFSKLRVSNCVFRRNAADYGAVVYCSNFSSPTITGCVMTDNHAFVAGSVLFSVDSYPALTNNTIVGNIVHNQDVWYATGVIHNYISKSRPVNCILWENPTNYFLGGQIQEGKPYYTIYNDIEGGYPGEGNFDQDPRFEESEPHPFRLTDSSPCINAGTPDTEGLMLPVLDLAGSPRIQLARIDVGAYEWGSSSDVVGPDRSVFVCRLESVPNPFTSATAISFALPTSTRVSLTIFDVAGRRVRSLIDGTLPSGARTIRWDGRSENGSLLRSGVYFCRMRLDGRPAAAKKIHLVN